MKQRLPFNGIILIRAQNSFNELLLRPFPATFPDTSNLTRLERLDLVIANLEQTQNDVKDKILLQALADKQALDSYPASDPEPSQPDLTSLKSKWRPTSKDDKPPDARLALKKAGNGLFVEQDSHAALVKETVDKLEAYEQGTPAALKKFKEVRERIKKEEEEMAGKAAWAAMNKGDGGAGSPGGQVVNKVTMAPVAALGYDASRDPRRRR